MNSDPVRYELRDGPFGVSKGFLIACGVLAVLVVLVLWPNRDRDGRLSWRSVCAANLRGIMQSFLVYAGDNNGAYPTVAYAPYGTVSNAVKGVSTGTTKPEAAIERYYRVPNAQAGSVPACLWMLVVNGQVGAKQFVCGEDRFGNRNGTAATDRAGNFFDNFQNARQLSYSAAYPWNGEGKAGAWWKDTQDASLPIVADMAPLQGTGKPKRDLTPASAPVDRRTWNSGNHAGEGQNVGFGDGHAEFVRSADVGQDGDNIYSMSGVPSRGPARFGGVAAGAAGPVLMGDKAPFDVVMVPVRDEGTGSMK
jgi:hypothetical protein